MAKICNLCLRTYSDQDSFCHTDGTPLVYHHSHQSAAPDRDSMRIPRGQIQQKSSNNIYIIIAAIVVSLAIVVAALLLRGGNSTDSERETSTSGATARSNSNGPLNNSYSPTPSASSVPTVAISPAGRWNGNWSSSTGAYYEFNLSLNESDGKADGQIAWKLLRTNRQDKLGMVGISAVEYVRGSYDPTSRALNLRGYRKDDPNGLLVNLDQYKLTVSPDGGRMSGRARDGGDWNGKISLSR